MSSDNHNTVAAHEHEGHHEEGMSKGKIWRVFFYLLAITVLEFFIALVLVHGGHIPKGPVVNFMYITLTLVKAYYIIAFFMHLKFERFGFIMSVSVVFVFIVYFIILMLTEGAYIHLHTNQHSFWPGV